MINFDDYVNENKTEQELRSHNKNWPYTPDHPYGILIIEGSGSGKTNVLLNLRLRIWKNKCIIKLNGKPIGH